jgi:Icc-related predicted phosphoesterase
MKIVATADLHQQCGKWHDLVNVCKTEKPDIVIIAGDLFPKDNGLLLQSNFAGALYNYTSTIKSLGIELILILGNDDNQLLINGMKEGNKVGLWHFVNDKVVTINGIEFAGCPWVPDHPFGYKYWCRKEFDDCLKINKLQLSKPLLINEYNKFEQIKDYEKFLHSRASIYQELENTSEKVKNIKNSVWLIHAPPADCDLDVCASGEKAGSFAVKKFIDKYQPLMTLHGHIHESPEYSGIWKKQINKTLAIQPGQIGDQLYYVTLNIKEGKISNVTHSIYDKK